MLRVAAPHAVEGLEALVVRSPGSALEAAFVPAAGPWTVRDAGRSHLRAELRFADRPELLAAFPYPHRVVLDCEPARAVSRAGRCAGRSRRGHGG